MGVGEVLKLFGLSAPLLYALATYGVFHYLDKRSSAQARKAIRLWLKPFEYDKTAVASAVVELFDRLYTCPLLHWRAAARSAVISLIIIAVFQYEDPRARLVFDTLQKAIAGTGDPADDQAIIGICIAAVLTNVLSDYLSLFFVRWWLRDERRARTIIPSVITGPLIGTYVVTLAYLARDFLLSYVLEKFKLVGNNYFPLYWLSFFVRTAADPSILTQNWLFFSAMAVHAWLLLAGLGVLVFKIANYFLIAVKHMQWFLNKGQEHPLDAIGYVAGVIVFVCTIVVRAFVAST
jgi:hypothetical protein